MAATHSHLGTARERSQAAIVWTIRVLAVVALGVSAYLAWLSMVGRGAMGCGPGSDCDAVLSSRWSLWIGVPVGVAAGAVYLAILFAMSGAGPRNAQGRRRLSWMMVTPLAVLAAGAGVWFVVLQFTSVGRVCPYCMAVHGCGLLIGALVAVGMAQLPGRTRDAEYRMVPGARPGRVWALVLVGAAGVAGLIAGQLLSNDRDRLVVAYGGGGTTPDAPPPPPTTARAKPPGPMVVVTTRASLSPATSVAPTPPPRFPIGAEWVELDPRALPTLGPVDAPYVIAMMSDFTCPHCRTFHAWMDLAVERYHGQLAVVTLTVPMDARCNPRIRQTHPRHVNACELARIALAVWRVDRGAYARMNRWLFEPATPRTPEEARAYAKVLIGEDKLRQGEADPAVEQLIARFVGLYDKANGGEVPKLLLPKNVQMGKLKNERELFLLLEGELKIRPSNR